MSSEMGRNSYVLGLDLGTNSVGYALIANQAEIALWGVRAFEEAGSDDVRKGTRELNNQKRRQFRLQRRNLRRKRARRAKLYAFLAELNLIPGDFHERTHFLCLHGSKVESKHPYALRAKAVTGSISDIDFARVLCHMNQRRGYLSTRDLMADLIPDEYRKQVEEVVDEETQPENPEDNKGVVLQSIREAENEARTRGIQTYGQLMWALMLEGFAARVYGKPEKNGKTLKPLSYRPSRLWLEEEFHLLWDRQAASNPDLWTPSRKEYVHSIIFGQRPLPPTHDKRKSCPFHKSHLCAPKYSREFQKNRIVQNLVQLTVTLKGRDRLMPSEVQILSEILMDGQTRTLDELCSEVGLPAGSLKPARKPKAGLEAVVKGDQTVAAIKPILLEAGCEPTSAAIDDILTVIGSSQWANGRYKGFLAKGYDEPLSAKLALVSLPEGYAEYSTKFLRKLTNRMMFGDPAKPQCEQHKIALDALSEWYRETSAPYRSATVDELDLPTGTASKLKLPENFNLRNPVVEKSLRQMIWVVNQIVRRYGTPERIHVELPRELSAPAKLKQEIFERQKESQQERERIKKRIVENGLPVTDTLVKKVRLADECGWRLPYEPDIAIQWKDLESGEIEIDHVVPRDHCWDNAWDNLVLSRRAFNLRKGNQTPYEYFSSLGLEPLAKFEAHVKTIRWKSPRKRAKILAKERPDAGFLASQFVNTGYLGRETLKLLKQLDTDVVVTKGGMTSDLRRIWQLRGLLPDWDRIVAEIKGKELSEELEITKTRSDQRHHAIDAAVVALTSRSIGMKITQLYKAQKDPHERIDLTPSCPIPNLRQHMQERLDDVVITYANNRRPSGGLNELTAREPAEISGTPLSAQVIEGKLVRFDAKGKAFAQYDLGNNHHVAIYRIKMPNKKGEHEVITKVVTMIEAARRNALGEDVFKADPSIVDADLMFTFCKGDIIEWTGESPGLYRIAKFSQEGGGKSVDLEFQDLRLSSAYSDLCNIKLKHDDDRLVRIRLRSNKQIHHLASRVSINAHGEIESRVHNLLAN